MHSADIHSSFILLPIHPFILTLSIFLIFSSITEISRLQGGGVFYGDDVKFLDVYREKCTRATIRVLVPLREHPKVGILLYCIEKSMLELPFKYLFLSGSIQRYSVLCTVGILLYCIEKSMLELPFKY